MATRTAAKAPRPVTKALAIVAALRDRFHFWANVDDNAQFNELQAILVRIDASTGKPDSARRHRRRPAKSAKKSARS